MFLASSRGPGANTHSSVCASSINWRGDWLCSITQTNVKLPPEAVDRKMCEGLVGQRKGGKVLQADGRAFARLGQGRDTRKERLTEARVAAVEVRPERRGWKVG